MNKYAKYLQRINMLMESLEQLHRYDVIQYKLPGYEKEMEDMKRFIAKTIDDQMAKDINFRLRERAKAS